MQTVYVGVDVDKSEIGGFGLSREALVDLNSSHWHL